MSTAEMSRSAEAVSIDPQHADRWMLIAMQIPPGLEEDVARGENPRVDYLELSKRLNARILSFNEVDSSTHPLIKVSRRVGGRKLALAALGFQHRLLMKQVFTSGEDVGIPLAVALKLVGKRVRHLMIAHRLSPLKKRFFWKLFALQDHFSKIFVYSRTQRAIAVGQLKNSEEAVAQIPFQVDHQFFRPMPDVPQKHQICSVGLEWRDYPTLIEAVREMNVEVRIAASSLWSKHKNTAGEVALPHNVSTGRYTYCGLRQMYAESKLVVVPLYETDFQAGITSILEGMAMGKTVVVSKTQGQLDTIVDGETGVYVTPEDPVALRQTIDALLADEPRRRRIGENARKAVEAGLGLDHLVERIARFSI